MREAPDVIVVGGGPAGALSACLLARRGWRVTIVEKGPRHRDKACGHCLNPRAMTTLDEVGLLADVRRLAVGRTDRLRLHRAGRRTIEIPLTSPRTGAGLVVERHEFDQCLLDAAADAGAAVRQPAIAQVERAAAGALRVRVTDGAGEERLAAPLVIGADGLRSAVGRAAGLLSRRPGRKYGFAFDVAVPAAVRPGSIEMFVVPRGYVGLVGNGVGRVHVAGLAATAPDGGATSPRAFLRDVAERFPELRGVARTMAGDSPAHFAACGPLPCRVRNVANARAALVGDAAGYVEPFTGEGMAWALQGATLLAGIASACGRGAWSARAAAEYERAWRRTIVRRQRLCVGVSKLLERPMLADVVLALGAGWPRLGRALARRAVAT